MSLGDSTNNQVEITDRTSYSHALQLPDYCSRITWQFILLIYKNFKLQLKRPIGSIIQLFLPILAITFIVLLRLLLTFFREKRCFSTFEPDKLIIPSGGRHIYFTPPTEYAQEVMNIVIKDIPSLTTVSSASTETELLRSLENNTVLPVACFGKVGIIFNHLDGNDIAYTIRLFSRTETSVLKNLQHSAISKLPGPRTTNEYLSSGFVHLQRVMGDAILKWKAMKENFTYEPEKVSVRQFPYPQYSLDLFLSYLDIVFPLVFVLAFLYTAGIIVRELVEEKETRIKEYMLMMGLSQWVLLTTWFIKQFIFLLPSIIVIASLVKHYLFSSSDWLLLFVLLIFHASSMICFCFFVSVWFNSARVGLIGGFMAWFANFFPFLFLIMQYRSFHFGVIVLSSLLGNTVLGYGIEMLVQTELHIARLSWTNLTYPFTLDKSFNMAWVLSMLIVDSVICMGATWYLNEVKPGKYGVPKPVYFPFLPSYWCNTGQRHSNFKYPEMLQEYNQNDPSAHERVRGKPTVGISIRNVSKSYSSLFGSRGVRKMAVENLSLDIYKGQITALLGHNGAGKTTTISILTGLFPPTKGTAIINGHNILTDMDFIRLTLGICPQHNILFSRLTVKEHLTFFMHLKGVHDRKVINAEVNQILSDLHLSHKGKTEAKHLSGGMKRKLSVAIALVGGSEVIILDEPTAGMDPYSRRTTWDLLAKYKQDRCILLSTHFMDEADLLSDRIAIMAEGRLCCSGSPLFLKSRYGVGYHMTMIKEKKLVTSDIEQIVKSFIASAEKVVDVGMELSFILPSTAAPQFPDLFEALEKTKSALGIASLGISITTMEEVFIKVTGCANEKSDISVEKKWWVQVIDCIMKKARNCIYSSAPSGRVEDQSQSISTHGILSQDTIDDMFQFSNSSVRKTNSCPNQLIYSQNIDLKTRSSFTSGITNNKSRKNCYASSDPVMSNSKNKGVDKDVESGIEMRLNWYGQNVKKDLYSRSISNKTGQCSKGTKRVKKVSLAPNITNVEEYGQYKQHELAGNFLSMMRKRNVAVLTPISAKFTNKLNSSQPKTTDLNKLMFSPLPPIEGSSRTSAREFDLVSYTTQNPSATSGSGNEVDRYRSDTQGDNIYCQYTPNKGITLWFQQFRAMFVKRFYYSVRFYGTLITQLVFPTCFAVVGLFVIINTNVDDDDMEIPVFIGSSIFDRRNTTFFYAELDENTINFSEFSAKDISVTNYFDISNGINNLRNFVPNATITDDCCNYRYQILDKFCASRNSFELNYCGERNPSFGYSSCTECLTCCRASNPMDTCSSFGFVPFNEHIQRFCPSPPSLSLHSSTSGPLDTTSTFVNEHLLRLAELAGTIYFFQSYQAGFTLAVQDPILSACDCFRKNGMSSSACSLIRHLVPVPCPPINSSCPVYRYKARKTCEVDLCGQEATCYSVEQQTAHLLPLGLCRRGLCQTLNPVSSIKTNPDNLRSFSKVHPENLPTPVVTIWYNNEESYMVAAALNAYQSMRLKQITRNKESSLTVVNHPLHVDLPLSSQTTMEDFLGYLLAILVVFGFSFSMANFVIFFVRENQSKVKHLQFVSGVSITNYWLSALLWDLLNALVPVILTVIVFRSFSVRAFHGNALLAVFLALVLTCWVAIPVTYVFSFFFSNALVAFSALVILFFIVTVLELVAIFFVSISQVKEKKKIVDILHRIFLWTPTYGLASTINDIYKNYRMMDYCVDIKDTCARVNITYVESNMIVQELGVKNTFIYLTVQGVAYIILVFLLELKFFIPHLTILLRRLIRKSVINLPEAALEDEDVCAERNRVLSGDVANDVIVLENLVKSYNCCPVPCGIFSTKTAVAGISLGIPQGECFGLLGHNGAGKTTTFNILTGDINMTSGTATICGRNIQTSLKTVRQSIGYCPQFDALILCMTASEQLWMYARLRGVPEKYIPKVVETELQRLDLVKYANVKCKTYSGGFKRRLSTAIAMVGNPPIMLLDEPTTGVDPKTRHYLWNVLTKATLEGRSIILTSHSMEECEALCTRLAIMINGRFRCLGSIQHLKSKYGSGITLQAKVKRLTTLDERISVSLCASTVEQSETPKSRFRLHHRQSQRSFFTHATSRSKEISKISSISEYNTAPLHLFVMGNFDDAVLVEEHVGAVTYWLPSNDISWSRVFRLLEEHKEKLGIVDYSVSQTTLEQVFIRFAQEQESMELK